jgi:hypothetical protein
MTSEQYACDLCSLPVETSAYHLNTLSGLKRFCCEGCEGIYQMLHGDEIVADRPEEDSSPQAPSADV